MLKKNQKINLKIEGMTTEGNGVGHFDGIAVFVPNTTIGDEIIAHILKVKKTYAFAKLDELIIPSPDRIDSDCEVSLRCGGCAYRHISYDAELSIKKRRVADAFTRIGHLDTPINEIIGSESIEGYRNKAQFPVGFDKELQIGFYALSSHRIIPCKTCKLQPEVFTDILNIIEHFVLQNNIPIYNEGTCEGLLRHIYIRKGQFTDEVMVCLVINGTDIPNKDKLIEELKEKTPNLKTVVLNINTENTNVITGNQCINIYGDGYITDRICGLTFRISPLSFFQVNTKQAEVLYTLAKDYAKLNEDGILLDLYCGTGTIGLTMANQVHKLYGVEIIPEAIEDAKINARVNNIQNAEFICADAAVAAENLRNRGVTPTVVLVDPPRKGLTPELIHTIVEMAPTRVVYISCDPATLARDASLFNSLGYRPQIATPVDMFPRTAHVETVAKFEKFV